MIQRRAVSEVIASLLLLLIVSLAGTALYSYSIQITQTQQDTIITQISVAAIRAQERFRVIAVWWRGSGSVLNVTVLYYGSSDIKISDVYINGDRVTYYLFGRNQAIYAQKWLRVAFTSPRLITQNHVYEITIVTDKGTSYVYLWEA